MFEKLTTDPEFQKYTPEILSRPGQPIGKYSDGPWVVLLHNVLTEEEANKLIELGGVRGYEQSYDVGKKKIDGSYDKLLNKERTSTNAWCVEDCYNHTTTQDVVHRIEQFTGVPDTNSEYLQLLRVRPLVCFSNVFFWPCLSRNDNLFTTV
jgi:prolyl 4-hydroxylase